MSIVLSSNPTPLSPPLQFRIEDPSGEIRIVPLPRKSLISFGRSETADVLLRDSTLPVEVAEFRLSEGENDGWIKLTSSVATASLCSIPFREASLPIGIPLEIGETRITLESARKEAALPITPKNCRAWKTASASGADLLWMTKKAAATPLSIYIAGETGTGKEVIASLIHAWSERAGAPFIPLHCGALAPSLAESELFGHVKGAYTGAHGQRTGAFLQAHGGTLFLDEVGDLSLDLQVKLLRFLENGEIRPVGSDQIRHADVRIVCATHLPLRKLVEEGKFRRDLYYRLASVTLEIPSLRSRPEDTSLLAREFAAELGKAVAPRTLLRLQAYSWPGNVRELRHAIERAAGLAGPFQTVLDDGAFEFLLSGGDEADEALVHGEIADGMLTLFEMERVMILRSLKLSRGNRADAAKILGVARSTLFEMLKRHRIEGPRAHLYREKSGTSHRSVRIADPDAAVG
jgi:transcriptional regulator with PAS, ATPase and Fis domain